MLGDHPVTMVSALTSSAAARCTMVDRSGVAVLAVLEARTDAVTCDCPAGARGQACLTPPRPWCDGTSAREMPCSESVSTPKGGAPSPARATPVRQPLTRARLPASLAELVLR